MDKDKKNIETNEKVTETKSVRKPRQKKNVVDDAEVKTVEIKTTKVAKKAIKVNNEDIICNTEQSIKEDSKEIPKTESNSNNSFSKKHYFTTIECILICIAFIIVFGGIGFSVQLLFDSEENVIFESDSGDENLDRFIDSYNEITNTYYEELDEKALIDKAIESMLEQLDDYSGYLDDESATANAELDGYYNGVGIEIYYQEDVGIVVSNVFDDSPASRVGLQVADVIIEVNGESLEGKDSTYLTNKIAELGKVEIKLLRDSEELTFELEKGLIVLQSVSYEMLENNVGYLKIDIFASNTSSQLKEALQELENMGMESLIIDVRNNTGGYLSTTEDILSQFLDSSKIMYKTENDDESNTVYSKGNETKDYEIVILQNFASASASELLTISLKENLGAYVIGTRSYGKGTIQTVGELNGNEYKITTSKWLSPNGNWINEVGITPDLEVILDEGYYENPSIETDNVINEALNYLK